MYLYESNFYLDMLCMYINVIVHVYYRTREKMGVGRNMLYHDLKKRWTKHEINLYMEHIK